MGGAILNLLVANRREEMDRILPAFEDFAGQVRLSGKIARQVMLVIEELVLNTILYGFPEGGEQFINLDISVQGKTLVVEIRDHGIPFDPFSDAPAPDLTNPTMERRIGGWGVHIVKKTMDGVMYRRDGDSNYIRVEKVIG
jgi:serine/threonine-protein kinase RsbW